MVVTAVTTMAETDVVEMVVAVDTITDPGIWVMWISLTPQELLLMMNTRSFRKTIIGVSLLPCVISTVAVAAMAKTIPPPCQVVGVVIPSQMSPITDNSQQNQQHQQPIPERGSQNGSGFGSSAYRNN